MYLFVTPPHYPTSVGIEVNERGNPMVTAVFIVRHGIMCRVQKKLGDFRCRKKLLHGEPAIKEADGVMPGGRAEERENRQVILQVGGSRIT